MLTRFMYYKTTDKRHLIYKYTITRSPSSSCSPSKSSKSSSPPSTNSSPFPSQVLHYQASFSITKLIILSPLSSSAPITILQTNIQHALPSYPSSAPITILQTSIQHALPSYSSSAPITILQTNIQHALPSYSSPAPITILQTKHSNRHFHATVLQVQCLSSLLPWGVLRL